MFFIDFGRLWMRNSLEVAEKNAIFDRKCRNRKSLQQSLGIAFTPTAQFYQVQGVLFRTKAGSKSIK